MSPLTLPPGFRAYEGGSLGFRLGLAPGWDEAGPPGPSGANFKDPSQQGALLVHFEQAVAKDLDSAAAVVMTELTGGSGARSGKQEKVTLSGRSARRVTGSFAAGGTTAQIDAIVTLDGDRAWVLALAGPADRVAADRGDFEQMAATFRLSAVRPSAPAHVALDLEAPHFRELDRIKGAVVVNFFATWCGPCREEMPLLEQRQKRANGRFTVLAVNTRDDASAVPSFLKQVGVSFPLAYDRDGRLSDAYQLFGVPQTFFLDAGHVVRDESAGPLTSESLERGLRKAGAA